MTKILFVCHGNICRSPMAEAVLKYLLASPAIKDKYPHLPTIKVASAACTRDALGMRPHKATVKVLQEHGIAPEIYLKGKEACLISAEDWQNSDYIIAMDAANIYKLRKLQAENAAAKSQATSAKEAQLLRLLEFTDNLRKDVADPWYTNNFEQTFDDIYGACLALIAQLAANAEED